MKVKTKQPDELSIDKLFDGNERYIIPIYQRNYAWGEVEREQLIEDIKDVQNEYFLGSLVVYERDDSVYEVIDGQQRLTTLFILLAALKQYPPVHTLKFEARRKSNRTLEKIVEGFPIDDTQFYTIELLEALTHFEQLLADDDELSEKLQKVKLLRIIVPDDTDLNHYFEIMNTRGEQLEAHEIVKARLMANIEGDNVQEKRATFSKVWDACSQMDQYVQMTFHPSERRALFGREYDQIQFKNFTHIVEGLNNTDVNLPEERLFSTSITEAINLYSQSEPAYEEDDIEEESRFESIITFPNFLLHVTNLLKQDRLIDDDQALDDKKLLERIDDKVDPLQFAFLLLKARFLFDQFIIKREYYYDYKEEGTWSLSRLKYYPNHKTINYVNTFTNDTSLTDENKVQQKILTLQSIFRTTYTSPKTMHWITRALSFLINNNHDETLSANYLFSLESYARKKVRESRFKIDRGLAIERIVYTYLDYILWRDGYKNIIEKMGQFEYTFRNSIEHFFPQTPDIEQEHDTLDKQYLHHFGNLCLITQTANSKFSNQSPRAKLTNKNTIASSQKLQIMAHITNENNWNESTIQKHGEEMNDLLQNELLK